MRVKELTAFIKERESIRVWKEVGAPRPWTKDPILATYRFCNVRREDDRVTRELGLLSPRTDYRLWFWYVVARLFNNPATMEALNAAECVLPFKPETMRKVLKKRREKHTIFNAAYIVSTNGKAMDKVDYLIELVLNPLWKDSVSIRPHKRDTLESWHQKLMMYDGLGSFLAAQIVADMKYVEPLKHASDWWTFAASGPGSRRGLNRVIGLDPNSSFPETSWRSCLGLLQEAVNKQLKWENPLHAQDIQNCLCEFDKMERARLGEGKPKQLYKPHGEK